MKLLTFFMMTCVMLAVLPACAGGNINVVGGLTRLMALKPGEKSDGRILIRNTGDAPQEVRANLNDYQFFADGRNLYDPPGSHPRSNAGWITFTPHQFTVPAGETVSIYYTIVVPEGADIKGTYWSILMVEPIAAEVTAPGQEKDKVKVGVQTIMRYGVQMIADLSAGAANLAFARSQLVRQDGKVWLLLDVENNGERYLTPQVWAEVFDTKGTSLGRFDAGRLRLFPGCSGRFRIDLSQLSVGKYAALIVADNGDDHVFGMQLKLDIQ